MGLNRFREQVDARIRLLDYLINMKEKALLGAPKGKLNLCKHGNYIQYYFIDDGGVRSYIPKEQFDLIRRLAQRDYDEEVLALAIKEKKQLERLRRNYPEVTMEEYYETMIDTKRGWVKPVWQTDREYIANWESAEYESKESADSEYAIVTNKGERVRSKSEKMIADRLAQLGIPYRYEAKLVLSDGTVIHPDFTLLDMKKRREVYLEHCGKMDDSDYSLNFVKRIRLYERNGIVNGDRLLMTFEAYKVPLDVSVLDQLTAELL